MGTFMVMFPIITERSPTSSKVEASFAFTGKFALSCPWWSLVIPFMPIGAEFWYFPKPCWAKVLLCAVSGGREFCWSFWPGPSPLGSATYT
jgi:hypothetical protein